MVFGNLYEKITAFRPYHRNRKPLNLYQQPTKTLSLPLGEKCCGNCGHNVFEPLTILEVNNVKQKVLSPSTTKKMFSRILPGRKSTSQKASSSSVPNSPKPQHTGMKRLDSWIGHLLRDGVGNNSSSSKPVVVTNRPPSIVVQGSGSNVAPQNPLQTPVQHVGPPNRSSWNQAIINPMAATNDSIFNRIGQPTMVAPLASREEIEENTCPPPPPRPAKNFHHNDNTLTPPVYRSQLSQQYHPRENRANVLLQQLRADDGAQSESDVSANEVTLSIQPPPRSQSMVIFLQYNDEVKRSQLPSNVRTVEQIKGLFLRSFPNLTHYYLNLPYVKVYIQEPSKGQLFYELDDIREIKDKSVLKIREQNNTGYQSPPPIRFTDHPPPTIADYVSEPEIDDYRDRNNRMNNSFRMRPASAVPGEGGRMYNPNSLTKPIRSHAGSTSSRYDSYYDPYSSDTSSQGPRSGSVTPIIDKETRFRMDTMERQLAGLSSLVHSALVSKGVSESTQKDMLDLRRQILEFHPEVSRFSNSLGKEPQSAGSNLDSTTSSFYRSPETQSELASIRKALQTAQSDVLEIRRTAQLNVQNSKDIISEAFQKIQSTLHSKLNKKDQHEIFKPTKQQEIVGEKLRKEHLTQLEDLQTSLRAFEGNVESIRKSVLNSNRKLRMTEVEQLTNNLTKIGRQAAKLKTQFPDLQSEIEKKIKEDMERVVREQNFIKEETNQIDSCLRRCKTLANMMVTMKKLAMVQDPAINSHRSSSREDGKPPLGAKSPVAMMRNYDNNPAASKPPVKPIEHSSIPPVPPSPNNYEKPSSSNTHHMNAPKAGNDSHVLDTILDELNSSNEKTKKNADLSTSLTIKAPPRPPERNNSSVETIKQYNTYDMQPSRLQGGGKNNVNSTFPPLPIQQTSALFDNSTSNTELNRLSALSSTESINSQEGLHDRAAILASNKERIDDKQRELNNQLEKLQKLCPTL